MAVAPKEIVDAHADSHRLHGAFRKTQRQRHDEFYEFDICNTKSWQQPVLEVFDLKKNGFPRGRKEVHVEEVEPLSCCFL